MIKELPEKNDQLEADLEQGDMFYQDDPGDIDPVDSYKTWRRSVRARGFRFLKMFSDIRTHVITVMFRRPK